MATPITDAQLAKFQKHLAKNAPDAACLVCKETRLIVEGTEVAASLAGGTASLTGMGLPTVAIVCSRCKFVMRFACQGIV